MPILSTRKFAITSDFYGVREDIPSVKMQNVFLEGSNNTFLQYGMVRGMPGRQDQFLDGSDAKTVTPDGNPIIRYHRHVSAAGIEYEFAFTKDYVYRWNSTTKVYSIYFTCGSSCTLWDSVSFHGKVVITNGIDKIQVWDEDTPGTVFAALGSSSGLDTDGGTTYVTTAKYLWKHENYLHLGYTTEGGTSYPFRWRWCGYGNEEAWQSTGGTTDAGYKDVLSGAGVMKGFGDYTFQGADIMVVFKTESLHPTWLTSGREVWHVGEAENVGLLATHSVVNDKEGNLYFIANDYTIRQYLRGVISGSIDKSVKGINQDYEANIEAKFIDQYKHIWWSIPSNAASTGNDKIFVYNLNYEIWHFCDFDIRAFGSYSSQTSYTIDGLDAIADTIDGLDAVLAYIDYVEALSGFPLDLGSDYSGYTYALHNSDNDKGNALSRDFVISTDLYNKRSLYEYKRIMSMRPQAKAQPTENTLTFSVKEDGEANYENVGTMELNGTGEYIEDDFGDIDQRAKHFLIKVSATNRFDFIGLFFEYVFDGDA
ncbi:MAG: hypothetical protein ACYS8Z_20640 [Planctomycetota bacterium]|jgi:hypothetical protein